MPTPPMVEHAIIKLNASELCKRRGIVPSEAMYLLIADVEEEVVSQLLPQLGGQLLQSKHVTLDHDTPLT